MNSPRTKRRLTEKRLTKQARYRAKMRMLGKCPHCGKPCAPYSECGERRIMKTIHHYVAEMVKTGEVERISRGVYRKANVDVLARGESATSITPKTQ